MSTESAHVDSYLFEPVALGPLQLPNRIVMAPLTRSRAKEADVPSKLAIEYYAQRATAGLIIAEATQISQQGKGYVFTPGIYDDAQVQAWKHITDAVHAKGGHMYLQLWHVGRISHPSLQPGNALPVAPSAIKPEGQAYTDEGFVPLVTPRALETSEMPGIVSNIVWPRKTRRPLVSMAWKSTRQTAICSISFCATGPINEPINMAAD